MSYQHWRDELATSHDQRLYPVEYQDELLRSGRGQFWATEAGALITELKAYPTGRVACELFASAGDLQSILSELKPTIEAWAKQAGCFAIIVPGRDGWRRVNPDYRHHQTILIKEL